MVNCPICNKPTDRRMWDNNSLPAPCCDECEVEARWRTICPPLYRDHDVSRMPEQMAERLAEVMAWHFGAKGMLLQGPTGTGKTRCAYLRLKQANAAGCRIIAFGAAGVADACATAYGRGDGPQWLRNMVDVDILFLDDLGKSVFTERADATLFALIEGRTSKLKPIIATTNLTGAELAGRLSMARAAPLIRRLREFCTIIKFE